MRLEYDDKGKLVLVNVTTPVVLGFFSFATMVVTTFF